MLKSWQLTLRMMNSCMARLVMLSKKFFSFVKSILSRNTYKMVFSWYISGLKSVALLAHNYSLSLVLINRENSIPSK